MEPKIVVRPPQNDDELAQAFALRYQIFIIEEGRARFVEIDEHDKVCQHLVAVEEGKVIGTLRLYLLNPGDVDIKIGRVAVQKERRSEGIGRLLMNAAHAWAGNKYRSVYLHAQVGVRGFYEKLGYVSEGEVFEEAGTPHVFMRLASL
jgi:predicted GNAT family N-acyltransferase